MITIGNMKDFKPHHYDEIWFIMRSVKQFQTQIDKYANVYHVPNLSPSYKLFSSYLTAKEIGKWNQENFDKTYVPKFLWEIHEKEPRRDLNLLFYKSKAGKKILVICSCSDETLCHRSIVGGLMLGVGADVISSTGNIQDYLHFYTKYKEIKPNYNS